MLIQQLKELYADGVIDRRDHQQVPPKVEYSLTQPVAAIGSATVVSCSILASYGPKHGLGRANAAFNLVHLVVAFAVQRL